MNIILTLVSTIILSAPSYADQKATLSCSGNGVSLKERSPYLGESSEFQQSLFILSTGSSEDNSTAYFLDVDQDITGASTGGAGKILFSGRNQAKGVFSLTIEPYEDFSDGTTVSSKTKGYITYSHGPLKGENTPVHCVLE